jgi:hypothetical protein
MERVQRQPIPNAINLVLVRSSRDQHHHEVGSKNNAEEPEINDKDWTRTLDKIKEYHSIMSLAAYKVPYNEYLVEIHGSLACSRDYLYWFKLAVLVNILCLDCLRPRLGSILI